MTPPLSYLWAFLEQAPVGFGVLSGPSFVLEVVNPLMAALWQRTTTELVGQPLFSVLPGLAQQNLEEALKRVFNTGTPYVAPACEAPTQAVGEEVKFVELAFHPLRNEQGQIFALACVATDVTKQVSATKNADKQARLLQQLADALPALVARIDAEERYVFANKAYEQWYGLCPDEIMGRSVREVIGEGPFQRGKANRERAQAGERVEFDITRNFPGGVARHVHGILTPNVQDGQPDGYYVLVFDVTDLVEARRAAESSAKRAQALAQTLQQANEQLTRTNVSLDNFIYSASHDLRMPITNVEGLLKELQLELATEPQQPGTVAQLLSMLQGEIARFQLTITDLTEVAFQQEPQKYARKTVSLATIIQHVRQDLAPLLRQTQAQLQVEVTDCAKVAAAPGHLRSIVYNLLSNALKYRSPKRRPTVQVRCHEDDQYTVLSVQDNGLGLDEQQRRSLFGRFKRMHQHVEGYGLGLYVVKRSVENAGGKVEIESELGVGSTFSIFLPRAN